MWAFGSEVTILPAGDEDQLMPKGHWQKVPVFDRYRTTLQLRSWLHGMQGHALRDDMVSIAGIDSVYMSEDELIDYVSYRLTDGSHEVWVYDPPPPMPLAGTTPASGVTAAAGAMAAALAEPPPPPVSAERPADVKPRDPAPEPPPLAERLAAEDKATRHAARRELIANARAKGGPRAVTDAADRFKRDIDAVEKAKLSQDVYDPDNGPPEGWANLSDDPAALRRFGLKPTDLEVKGSDFRAQFYQPDPAVFGPDAEPVLAFKGSSTGEDWGNNIRQGINLESPYYEQAVDLGRIFKKEGFAIDITGHSLGGGLASAASRSSGLPATTFNAAGLNPKTVKRYGGVVQSTDILAFRTEGEVLTHLQEDQWGSRSLMHDAVGTPIEMPALTPLPAPPNPEDYTGITGFVDHQLAKARHAKAVYAARTQRHGLLTDMIPALEAEKEQDQAQLLQARP